MGLYDAVRKEQPRRRFHPLWAAALVFAVALVTVLGLVISKPQRDHDRFVQCMSEISSSTTYALARKHTNLQAQVDGQSLRITQENGYALYGKLFNMGAVFSRDVPKGGGIRLDYGDGAVMELWPYRLPAGVRPQPGAVRAVPESGGKGLFLLHGPGYLCPGHRVPVAGA